MEWNKILHDPRHLAVPSCVSRTISEPSSTPILHRHKQCLQTDRNEIPLDPRHLGVSSGVCKMIFEPMVCLAQTVHLSCVKISPISKRTEMSFRLSLITSECHRVHLKWFLNLWYVRRKPCTYLVSRLAYLQMDRNEVPLEPRHLAIPSGASKMIS
jgi:hypothetical protein